PVSGARARAASPRRSPRRGSTVMAPTLTQPEEAVLKTAAGDVATVRDHGADTAPAADRVLDAWRPDDPPGALLAELVALFNTDARRDAATIALPIAGTDPDAIAAYITRAVREGVIDAAQRAGDRLNVT